jgi:transposase
MLQIVPQIKILVAKEPVDFRKGIDGLAGLCRSVLQEDPFSGRMFIFTNKRRQGIKVLIYDGNGFWLCHKRFSKGRVKWWPSHLAGEESVELAAHQVQLLLFNGQTDTMESTAWRKVQTN